MAKLNGESFDITSISPPTIAALLQSMNLERMVAVEVNHAVIAPEKFSSFEISQNDEIEIIQFVGGG